MAQDSTLTPRDLSHPEVIEMMRVNFEREITLCVEELRLTLVTLDRN